MSFGWPGWSETTLHSCQLIQWAGKAPQTSRGEKIPAYQGELALTSIKMCCQMTHEGTQRAETMILVLPKYSSVLHGDFAISSRFLWNALQRQVTELQKRWYRPLLQTLELGQESRCTVAPELGIFVTVLPQCDRRLRVGTAFCRHSKGAFPVSKWVLCLNGS